MAGIKLGLGARTIFFGTVRVAPDPTTEAVLATVAGSSRALPGTDVGSVKLTRFTQYPAKGRATGGVRCHRFLKGEDALLLAWAGPTPVVAAAASGSPVTLPAPDDRRDGSGVPGSQPIDAFGSGAGG